MLPRISSLTKVLAEIFSDEFSFGLPYFQRGYAWQIEHAEQLLADVIKHAEGYGEIDWYPIGNIIVAKPPDDRVSWVTDGHQRLMTLTIMLSILRDLETKPDLKARLEDAVIAREPRDHQPVHRLSTLEAAGDCLRSNVQAPGATLLAADTFDEALSESEANILANRDYLRERLRKLGAARRRVVAGFLLDRCVLIVTVVEDQKAARLLFAKLHDTGLRPTSTDLFKAHVLGRVEAEDRPDCQATWESLDAALGHETFNGLLRHIAAIAAGEICDPPPYDALESCFNLDDPEDAKSFVQSALRLYGDHLTQCIEAPSRPETLPPHISRRLQYLSLVKMHDTWVAPLLAWLSRYGPAHQDTPEFVHRLEALAWSQMIIGPDVPARDARYGRVLKEITAESVLKPGSALFVTRAEHERIRENLLIGNLSNRKYRHFLMLRINASFEGDDIVTHLPHATIEHIFPRRPRANSQWHRDFKPGQASALRNSLGNLTLLTAADQDRTANKDFAQKLPILAASEFALSRRLSNRTTWTPDDIRVNSEAMVDALMHSWGVS